MVGICSRVSPSSSSGEFVEAEVGVLSLFGGDYLMFRAAGSIIDFGERNYPVPAHPS